MRSTRVTKRCRATAVQGCNMLLRLPSLPQAVTITVGEYVILYVVDGEKVFILRVVNGRRDVEELFGS